MKKFFFVAFMGAILFFSLTSMMNMDPPANSQCQEICLELGDLGLNHGQCVSFCNSCLNNGNTGPVCICNEIDYLDLLEEFGFKNFGQCVKFVRKAL